VKHASNEIMFLTFESLTWVIGGIAISHPTPAQLAAMRPGVDGARLAPPRSKPDQTGEIHCPFSVVLTYHPDDPINAAAALRDIHRGRRYEDIQVQTSSLMLIKPLDTLDQQGP
jgi:hypothetical protein